MKRFGLTSLGMVLLSASQLLAADLLVSLQSFQYLPIQTRVVLTPITIPSVSTNSLIPLVAKALTTGTNGQCTFSNSVAGYYSLSAATQPPLSVRFAVADTNGLVNVRSLLTNTITLVTNLPTVFYGSSMGATNSVPVDPASPVLWMTLQLTGDTNEYRVPVYK